MAYASLEQVLQAAESLNNRHAGLRRTNGLWHVFMFLRNLRLRGEAWDAELVYNAYDLSEAAFDIAGIHLPITADSRNTYFEPAATQGKSPAQYFRQPDGPRQTFLNRIYTGLTGNGQKQPKLFKANQNRLPVSLALVPNWIETLRQNSANAEILDGSTWDLICWLFRFGVPKTSNADTASIAIDANGNGLLGQRGTTILRPIASNAYDIVSDVENFLGLSAMQLKSLIPQLEDVDVASFESQNGVAVNTLGEALEQRYIKFQAASGRPTQLSATHSSHFLPAIEIPDRIRRMVRVSIAAFPAVILVGAPGTGKTALLREIIADIQRAPSDYGFSHAPLEPIWVTPDESWTTRDLIGGESIDDQGHLRFRMGHILRALAQDRWLVLDEANRGDLDRIFGALLTWLSDTEVYLGNVSREQGSGPIRLGWSATAECQVENIEGLDDSRSEKPISFLAGTEWRLLGTYNPLDAHKVFRLGQALARRFAEIPVPPAEPEEFAGIIAGAESGVPPQVSDALTALYASHCAQPATRLGPAIFLRCLEYVSVALAEKNSSLAEGGPEEQPQVAKTTRNSSEDAGLELTELITEAYAASAGKYIAKLETEELNQLGKEIVQRGALPETEWRWLMEILPHLS